MADAKYSYEIKGLSFGTVGVKIKWVLTGTEQNGEPVLAPGFPDKTVHVIGKTWGNATIIIQGSNQDAPVNYVTLKNAQGQSLSVSSDALGTILESPLYIRPSMTGGTDSEIEVILIAKKS